MSGRDPAHDTRWPAPGALPAAWRRRHGRAWLRANDSTCPPRAGGFDAGAGLPAGRALPRSAPVRAAVPNRGAARDETGGPVRIATAATGDPELRTTIRAKRRKPRAHHRAIR